MKQCRDCLQNTPWDELVNSRAFADGKDTLCLSCNRKRVKLWRKANPEKRKLQHKKENKKDYVKNKHLKACFGITLEEYKQMLLAQNDCCAICNVHSSERSRMLSVDHCHTTGKIRALLCLQCNTLLGMAKDNTDTLQKAINYLQHHS